MGDRKYGKGKRSVGCPSKCTPEVMEKMREGLMAGLSYRLTAAHMNIAPSTFTQWKGEAISGNPKFVSFLNILNESEALYARQLTNVVRKKALKEGDTKSAQWLLERGRTAKDFANHSKVEQSNKQTNLNIETSVKKLQKLSDDERADIMSMLEKEIDY